MNERTFNLVEGLDGVTREVPAWQMTIMRPKVIHERTVKEGRTFKFFYRQVEK